MTSFVLAYTAGPTTTRPGSAADCEPRRGVHRVAGDHPVAGASGSLEVHEHLAGLDADPHLELRAALGGERPVQLGQDGLHLEPRPDRALGVVLVRRRDAEQRRAPRPR